jgi:lipopolysaccharide transport system permease protein
MTMKPLHEEPHVLVLAPGEADHRFWRDLWHYRDLLVFLAWRDIAVRYRQTIAGVAWALLQPAMTMILFTIIFGRLAHMDGGGMPYPLLVLAGLIPWQLFSAALTGSGDSLVANAGLISKVYFPRIIIPMAAVSVAIVNALVALGLLAVLMPVYGVWPTWRLVALPLLLVLTALIALGAGLVVAAMGVRYRDIRFVLPFVVQCGFFAAPVGYSTVVVPEHWRMVFALNPMVGVMEGFRWSILGHAVHELPQMLAMSAATMVVLLVVGRWAFRAVERDAADWL